MAFELGRVRVDEVALGARTRLTGGHLEVDGRQLAVSLAESIDGIRRVNVYVVHPGDATRLVCVKDAVEPRVKVSGRGPGRGRTHALEGVAVVTLGQIVGFQEGLIDMSGPGAAHSPFSRLELVVLEIEPTADLAPHAHEAALRAAGLRAAEILGACAAEAEPHEVESFELPALLPGLPRVAYVYMLLSQGLLHDTWVLGRNAREGLPRLIDPGLPLDTGIVSGNCVSACDKNTTWHHQNNRVIRELFRRHGRELAFAGCVLTNEPVRLGEKRTSAAAAVELVHSLDADGAVLSKEGFGNPDADLMLLIRGLESVGVRCVAITDEFAGADGGSQSLADAIPEADAIVSTGNANERILLPPLAHTLGPVASVPRLAGAGERSLRADGSLEVELQVIVGSCNQLGAGRLRAREV